MSKPKTKRKVFNILLCFAMLMSLLPVTASAAKDMEIRTITAEVSEPVVGQTPSWNISFDNELFSLIDMEWIDEDADRSMSPNETFKAGTEYEVRITLQPDNGYKITRKDGDGDSHWFYDVDVEINDQYAGFIRDTYNSPYDPFTIRTWFETPNADIDRVEIEGITAPAPYQNPQFRASTPTKGVKLTDGNNENAQNGVYWQDYCCREDMGAKDTFMAGHQYKLIVHAETTNGYAFVDYSDWYDAYVNGKPADIDHLKKNEVDIIYFFDCENEVVTSVEVEDINVPKDGSLPDYRGTIYDPAVSFKNANNTFTQNGISWFNVTDNWTMTPNDRFEAGKQYQVTIELVPADSAYTFNVTEGGFLNGKDCTVTKNGSGVKLDYIFTVGLNTVSKVEADGISAPKAGGFPSYVAIARGDMELKDVNNTNFSNGIAWYDKTAGKYVPVRGGVFEAGHEYLVELYLVPEDGAEFDGNAKATVNGEKANIVTASKKEFYITYNFGMTGTETINLVSAITEAVVKGITAPKAGEMPDYTATANSDYYTLSDAKDRFTKNGITWKNETTGKSMNVGIDKFEAGNVYSVTVALDAVENCTFLMNSRDELDVDGYIDGEKAVVFGRDESEAYLTLTFDRLPETEVPAEPETPVEPEPSTTPDVPATPQKQSNFTDVKAGAYYEKPVQWAVDKGVTSGTSKTEFSPNMTCSQAHILTFLWRSVDKPATEMASPYSNPNVNESKYYYTPFVWAWEKGMVGNVKHDPNAPCSRADVVSYLWKLEGKPAAGTSQFTDVSANADYADAVAWAVENGITSGTSKTTFSPDDTCTRGQIVSFLYRYNNLK